MTEQPEPVAALWHDAQQAIFAGQYPSRQEPATQLGNRHPEADGQCPTGCGRRVRAGHLMCGPCWAEVPKPLQSDVLRTWRAYSKAARAGADDFPEKREAYEQARSAALASIR